MKTGFFAEVRADLESRPRHELALTLTAFAFVSHPFLGNPLQWQNVAVSLIGLALLVSRVLLLKPHSYFALFGVSALSILLDWPNPENHKYLTAYWALACGLSLCAKQPERILAHNARWLVALSFAFAAFWKLIAGEFLNGSFFHYALLTDYRFFNLTSVFGGLEPYVVVGNLRAMDVFNVAGAGSFSVALNSSALVRVTSLLLSYWTLLIELVIVWAFAAPAETWMGKRRDWALMLFVATTYLIAPVFAFAFLLCIAGVAQSDQKRSGIRLGYLGLCVLAQLTRLIPDAAMLFAELWFGGR